MPTEDADKRVVSDDAGSQVAPAKAGADAPQPTPGQKEIGGRKGPDPTRYGDWEKNGRCIDF